ncbi:GntR family transcriptional regulator [Sporosarcina aquimarina]|uniref:GntR family transcriptional regulator n=1 Tax=Sporosarcina aquimarina TaxID=114975 RepID=A0ABU4FYV4_9BACL|nr:GntR family transcriptional regulator [Sporosarcina aquimarina]MDW0109891.1 GntR family transcriptional regulator [Sporosarcina aquimarina]
MLDKQSAIPIYVQIEDYLKQQIAQDVYPVKSIIPSERELSELFGVSRMTVRQSLTNLVKEGLLYREKGRGTFVAEEKMEQPLNGLTSFTEDMKARGLSPGTKLIGFSQVRPDPQIRARLGLSSEALVHKVVRIRYADNTPMAIERSYLPVDLLPTLSEEALQGSLYAFIEQQEKLVIGQATQRMEAALAKKEDAEYLQIAIPAAVVQIERVSTLEDGRTFEVVRSTYRSDRYKFISEIGR